MKNYALWKGLTAILILVFCLVVFFSNLAFVRVGDVNRVLGVEPPTVEITEDTTYYPSDFDSREEMTAALAEHVVRVQEEGSVLLKNEANALPLASGASVTLFGSGAANSVFHGGSGGPVNAGVTLYDALRTAGFTVNDAVYDVIESGDNAFGKTGDIGELDVSAYSSVRSSFADYSDAAIVVLRRYGGEEGELNHGMGDGGLDDGNRTTWESGPEGVPELALHQEEKDLLNMIESSGEFDKTVVLVNSGYAMDLGWLDDYGVDACLWIGYPGGYGMTGVANVLAGKADPSGRLVDTYATDSLSSPAMQNSGNRRFTNLNTLYKNKFTVYAEGIYVGYKYYETRYQDLILGVNNADGSAGTFAGSGDEWNYADEMAFTFGSGGSYADFTQALTGFEWDRETHTVTATVSVTNNGDETYEGKSKDVVQLYVQLPWEEGMAEKPAVQLAAFGKTVELAAGEDTKVELKFSDYIFATYDENAVNGADTTKKGCYTFDAGDYHFAIGDDAHDALNNILAARGASGMYDAEGAPVAGDTSKVRTVTLDALDNTTYATSQRTGEVVSNLFADRDLNYFIEDKVTYLTRADWNTFPTPIENFEATPEIVDLMENPQYEKPADAPDISSFKFGQDVTIKFVELKDVEWEDDDTWNTFIDQLDISSLVQVAGEQMGMAAMPDVGLPAYLSCDGPDGHQNGELFNAEVVAASTFSPEMLTERGYFFGEEAYWLRHPVVYGPGANIHRTPYSGRNFEYYSEDGNMSYYCGMYQVREMSRKGALGCIKHFAGNDSETNRHGVATFMNEQTYRQSVLRGFEGALADGNGLATMTAYNRVGCVPTACDYTTMTTVLRGEWGFRGLNMTDSSKDSVSYMPTADCVHAGSEQFNNDPGRIPEVRSLLVNDQDGHIWSRLRDAAKHYFYAVSRSVLINGLTPETEVSDFVPWWQPALIVLNVVVGLIAVGCGVMFALTAYRKKKEA